MAKRIRNLPTVLRSLSPDELECIRKEATRLGLTAHQFVVHAKTQGSDYIGSLLEDLPPESRSPLAPPGVDLKSST